MYIEEIYKKMFLYISGGSWYYGGSEHCRKKNATYKRTSLKLEMSLQKFREKVKYIVYTS